MRKKKRESSINPLFHRFVLKTPPQYPTWLIFILVILSYIPILGSFILSPLERSALTWSEKITNKKAKTVLGMKFRPIKTTIKDGVLSMIEQGYFKPKTRR